MPVSVVPWRTCSSERGRGTAVDLAAAVTVVYCIGSWRWGRKQILLMQPVFYSSKDMMVVSDRV